MEFVEYTNKGPRKENEDSFCIIDTDGYLFAAIADGVGGIRHGKFASNYIVEQFEILVKGNKNINLVKFVNKINDELINIAKNEFHIDKIATTFTAGIISENLIKGVHTGDSRVCILRGNGIKQLTDEHNEVGRLMREGKLKPEDRKSYPRKNIIESIVGVEGLLTIQEFSFELIKGDRILFSTDGFHESLTKKELRDISIRAKSLGQFHKRLQIEIENRILQDNATFICIEI